MIRSHLSASLVPSVLALGEENKISGEKLLLCYILGYRLTRIGQVMTPSWIERGLHGTSVLVFWCNCCSRENVAVNFEQLQNAFGIAASMEVVYLIILEL